VFHYHGIKIPAAARLSLLVALPLKSPRIPLSLPRAASERTDIK